MVKNMRADNCVVIEQAQNIDTVVSAAIDINVFPA